MAPKKAAKEGALDNQVIKRLHQILKNADLEKTTVKNIQKQLEADLNIVLSDRKQFIRDEVSRREANPARHVRRAKQRADDLPYESWVVTEDLGGRRPPIHWQDQTRVEFGGGGQLWGCAPRFLRLNVFFF